MTLRRRQFLALSVSAALSLGPGRSARGAAVTDTGRGASDAPESWTGRTARALAPAAIPDLADTLQRATEILPTLGAAISPTVLAADPSAWAAQPMLGKSLSVYARNVGADPQQFEPFEAAARRIVAGAPATARPPDATSRWLDETAAALDAVLRSAATVPGAKQGAGFARALAELKALALLSRFHARRMLAAVHYNLFFRSQRLAELYAATLDTRLCLATWRDLAAVSAPLPELTLPRGPASITVHGAWQEELTRLGHDLADLEAQCCPPDEAMLQEKVWMPGAR